MYLFSKTVWIYLCVLRPYAGPKYIDINRSMNIYIYIFIYIYIHVYVYIHMYINPHVYIYI